MVQVWCLWWMLGVPYNLGSFLLTSSAGLGKRKKPNLCGNMQSMPLFGVYGWSIILGSLSTNFQTNKSCEIRSCVLLLFGANHMIFLEVSLLDTFRDGKIHFIYSPRPPLLVLVCARRMCCPLFVFFFSSY